MRSTRTSAKALALFAGTTLVLGACSTASDNTSSSSSGSAAGGSDSTITTAWEAEFTSYNNQTTASNATENTVVLNGVQTGFWYLGADGSIQPNKEFGTYEKTADKPLTVKYTVNDKAVWSDGTAIDCDDFLLEWASQSGQIQANKKDIFQPASTSGYELMNVPTCNKGDKSFTVTYKEPFADWASAFGGTEFALPAHVVEKQAGLTEDQLIEAIKKKDAAALAKAAAFWNKGWVPKPGQLNKETMLSSGPYVLDSWAAGQSITLKANPKWWGTPAKTGTIVIRKISPESQPQALQNGEVQVIAPQAQVDVVKQLEAIGDSITVSKHDFFTFEHFDFNFKRAFKDPDLRKAFALCMPRQQIVDNLIKPVNSNAVVMQVRYVFPFEEGYQAVVDATNAKDYAKPDVAAAKKILQAKGKVGTVVRIGYQSPNPRRTNQVALIKSSCDQAGFKIQDAAQSDFFAVGLDAGNFDIAMFAWAGSPQVSGTAKTYVTNGGQNKGHYSNPKVDALTKQLNAEPDAAKQKVLIAQIEKILWADLATIPVFAHPGVDAWSKDIDGVQSQVSQTQITWNMYNWSKKS